MMNPDYTLSIQDPTADWKRWVKFWAGQELSGLKVSRVLLGHILIMNFHQYLQTNSKVQLVNRLNHVCSRTKVIEWERDDLKRWR